MDIGKSISFVFEDKKWIEKVLVGGLVVLATILLGITIIGAIVGGALLLGYMVQLVRNVRNGDPEPLPEWDEWGEKIVSGIKLMVIYFIWSLPLVLLSLPGSIMSALIEDSGFAGLIAACFGCLSFLYWIILFLAMPAITIRFAENGEITDGLEFSEILAFTREHIGDIIIAVIILWVVQLIAGIIGTILCGIGLIFTMFWTILVQGHLYGQIGREKTALVPTNYDLSPDDVMPGVGELTADVEDTAEFVAEEVEEAVESTADVVEDAAEAVEDAGEAVVETAEEVAEKLPDLDKSDDV